MFYCPFRSLFFHHHSSLLIISIIIIIILGFFFFFVNFEKNPPYSACDKAARRATVAGSHTGSKDRTDIYPARRACTRHSRYLC